MFIIIITVIWKVLICFKSNEVNIKRIIFYLQEKFFVFECFFDIFYIIYAYTKQPIGEKLSAKKQYIATARANNRLRAFSAFLPVLGI